MRGYDLPRHVAEAVKRETAGQQVHWCGQSSAAKVARATLIIWWFAIPWTSFMLFWEYMALSTYLKAGSQQASIILPLWGIPFVAVGLLMMSAPYWAARATRNTAHVIAGDEVLDVTATTSGKTTVKRRKARAIRSIERTELANGSGSLKLVMGWDKDSDGDRVENSDTWFGIPNVRRVEGLIRDLQRGS
jgi:hypothetical protein